MLTQGQIFDTKYEILKILGSGGMGTVYLAQNIKLGTLWAIKEVNKNLGNRVDLLAEPNILKKLNHGALPRIFDIIEDSNYIYIIMDYIEGIPLDKELKKEKRFSEKQAIEWMKQICDTLKYLHSMKPNPIIYRDMKPSNLIIACSGDIKIIDFGIAREFKKESTADTTYIGTRGYAAPEQYGTSQTDARTDIYSLGVTMYHILTGKSPNDPPYEIKPLREINIKLSRGIEHIIAKCTNQDPLKRYQSVDSLLKDLKNIHKFDIDFKRKVLKRDLTVGAIIFALLIFGYITLQGSIQLKKEKVDDYNERVSSGVVLREKGSYSQASAVFTNAALKIPERPNAYKEEALVYIDQLDYDGCIKYINDKSQLYIDDFTYPDAGKEIAELNYILGTAYYEKNDYINATSKIEKALDIIPNDIVYRRDLIVCLAKSGKIDEAEKELKRAIKMKLGNSAISYVSGEIYQVKRRYKDAVKFFIKAIDETKDENIKRKAFLSLANTYKATKDFNSEIETLERSKIELKGKENIVVIEMLGEAYANRGKELDGKEREMDYIEAISNFERLLSYDSKRTDIMGYIGSLYQENGELKDSEKYFIQMRDANKTNYEAYKLLTFLYAQMEEQKNNALRNYTKTEQNYELALKYYKDAQARGIEDLDMIYLEDKINLLKKEKWI